jgi:LmbE family N-acetylglucosaminyl deacetylase
MTERWRDFGTVFNGAQDGRLSRVLVVVAHPSDLVAHCAGTVHRLAARGVHVELVMATSGDRATEAGPVPSLAGQDAVRRWMRDACRRLGVAEARFLDHPEAELAGEPSLMPELVAEIRRTRPEVVMTFDPTPALRQHPDHRVLGRTALDAAWPLAGSPHLYPAAGEPHQVREAWLFDGPTPDLFARLEADPLGLLGLGASAGPPGEERFAQVNLR